MQIVCTSFSVHNFVKCKNGVSLNNSKVSLHWGNRHSGICKIIKSLKECFHFVIAFMLGATGYKRHVKSSWIRHKTSVSQLHGSDNAAVLPGMPAWLLTVWFCTSQFRVCCTYVLEESSILYPHYIMWLLRIHFQPVLHTCNSWLLTYLLVSGYITKLCIIMKIFNEHKAT